MILHKNLTSQNIKNCISDLKHHFLKANLTYNVLKGIIITQRVFKCLKSNQKILVLI